MQVKVEDVEDPSSLGCATSPTRNSTSICLESAFKFPAILDFEHSDRAVSSNNGPVRAYEYTVNGPS